MIEKMRKAPDPTWKTKAFFTLRTKNFLIHNCRLVLADSGRLVVQMPYTSKLERGKKTFEVVIEPLSVDYLEAVTAQAISAYQECLGKKK
jgi:DNA-binding cell septation regulator SpoVG